MAILLSGQPLSAQTSTLTLGWDQPVTAPAGIAEVNAYTYALKINAAAAVQVVQACVAGAVIKCTTPLPSTVKSGDVLTLTASNGLGSASAPPLTVGGGASAPVNVTVIVKVTVP